MQPDRDCPNLVCYSGYPFDLRDDMSEIAPVRWTNASRNADSRPGMAPALRRGVMGKCPNCGRARLFTGWLRQVGACPVCAAPLGAIRADDAPPYFVVFLVGHLVIATQVLLDGVLDLSVWAEAAVFLPLTLALALGLLRPVKGATIGLMWQLGMVPDPDA
jgi:uncharacterized protein (DUF983 family)